MNGVKVASREEMCGFILKGMVLPLTVNLTFICKYGDGKETVSDESIEVKCKIRTWKTTYV